MDRAHTTAFRRRSGTPRLLALGLVAAALCLAVGATSAAAAMIPPQAYVVGDSSQPIDVPQFFQTDEAWGSDSLGSCSPSVASSGCAVTSLAMVLKYFGVDTNPGALNSWLRDKKGYVSGCLIYWPTVADIDRPHITWVGTVGQDRNRLKHELDSGYPVVLEVHVGSSSHFIVATGYSGDTVYIHDTTPDGGTSLDFYGNTFVGMRIFHGVPAVSANSVIGIGAVAGPAITAALP